MSILVKNVWMRFKGADKNTLEDIRLEVKDNEFLCIIGPSGCGKSTFLNLVAGLSKATSGKIYVDDKEVRGPGLGKAVMFQESALFPWLNVRENVMFGMSGKGFSKQERQYRADQYIEMVGLSEFQHYYTHEISGGMKQRAALARALALDSSLLLMDEPFAALDSRTKDVLRKELIGIWERSKKTIVFVTHSIDEAVQMADRIIVMTARPGRIKGEYRMENPRCMKREERKRVCAEIRSALTLGVEHAG